MAGRAPQSYKDAPPPTQEELVHAARLYRSGKLTKRVLQLVIESSTFWDAQSLGEVLGSHSQVQKSWQHPDKTGSNKAEDRGLTKSPDGVVVANKPVATALLYGPIPVTKGQTRLLRLQHGAANQPLQGELIVASVSTDDTQLIREHRSVRYMALSYTWGNGPYTERILLNGLEWAIKENLYDFLCQHRSEQVDDNTSLLWVDALCINQQDDQEKTEQVSSMMTFYACASLVISWLGKAIPQTGAAVAYLHTLQGLGRNRDVRRMPESTTIAWSPAETGNHSYHDFLDTEKTITEEALEGLRHLYSRSWPRRMWIRQEIWSAESVVIQCGSHKMSLDLYKAGVSDHGGLYRQSSKGAEWNGNLLWIHKKLGLQPKQYCAIDALAQRHASRKGRTPLNDMPRNVSHGGPLAVIGGSFAWAWRPSFFQQPNTRVSAQTACQDEANCNNILALLEQSVSYESTDVRDRIFALAGMCCDPVIDVDYKKPPSDVFIALAKKICFHLKNLGVVLQQNGDFGKQPDLDLPSWVPDWRTFNTIKLQGPYNGSRFGPYLETGSFDLSESFRIHNPRTLHLNGITLGTVETVTHHYAFAVDVQVSKFDAWKRDKEQVTRHLTGLDSLEVRPLVVLKLTGNRNQCTTGDILFACNGCSDPVILRPSGADYTFVHTTFCVPPGTTCDPPDLKADVWELMDVARQFERQTDKVFDGEDDIEGLKRAMDESKSLRPDDDFSVEDFVTARKDFKRDLQELLRCMKRDGGLETAAVI